MPGIRTVMFGDPQAGLWGGVWSSASCSHAVVSLGADAVSIAGEAALEGSSPTEAWGLTAAGAQLAIAPEGEPVLVSEFGGLEQLCRIRGSVARDGTEHSIEAIGRRTNWSEVDLQRFGSIREVSAFFADDDVLALTALRPRDARGHDQDLILSSLFDSGHIVEVTDPRFSTTYTAGGSPARVGLELWLPDDESGAQYPRRAVAAALDTRPVAHSDGLELEASAMRWHSRGREGIGVYALAQLQ